MASQLVRLEPLARELYRETVRRALNEDVRDGDITTDATVPPAQQARGVFVVKSDCVIAGLDVAFEAFRQLDPHVRVAPLRHDGDACRALHVRTVYRLVIVNSLINSDYSLDDSAEPWRETRIH